MNASDEIAVASAKISRPRGNRPILRPRLFERLDALRESAVTWISGAPGAGKTTLASSYLANRNLHSLWYQLDADDADVANFFYYLGLAVAQAARHDKRATRVPPSLTPEYLPGLMSFTRHYAETLAACIELPAVIVLDNYEQLPVQALLHDVVRELASSLPQGLSLLVLSRTEPPAPYARLRLHERLAVLDGHELNLTRDEALSLSAAREAGLHAASNPQQIDQLLLETQGWFAGFTLRLAEGGRPDMPGSSARSQQLIFDYFATELFERFEPATQDALLRTALLPRMTLDTAQRMSGDPQVGVVLAQLHRQNCFVVQHGNEHPVYEYHTLFRAFLLNRGAATNPPEQWHALQCHAADLLSRANQADAAAALYRAAQDWAGLATLALREAPALIDTGRHRTLEHWLGDLPSPLFQQSPWLAYWLAMARLPFDPAAARIVFEQAYGNFQDRDEAAGLYLTWAGAMESFFYEWRDFSLADRWIAEFDRLRARHPQFPSRAVERRTYWAMGTLLHRQPQHPLLIEWSERALILLDATDRELSILMGGFLVIWFLWRGETAKSRGIIEQITPWAGADTSPMVLILWYCGVGLFHSVQGDTDNCGKAVQAGLELARRTGLHSFDSLLAAQMARSHLVAGNPAGAENWMATMAGTMRNQSHSDGAFYRHLQCNAAGQRGNWQQALDIARDALPMALSAGMPFLEAHCHIDLARAMLGGDDEDEWASHIDAARAIGQTMNSRVVEYLCLEAETVAAFKTGHDDVGLDRLALMLAASHAMDGATWRMAGPQADAWLYERALATDIEVAHVQRLIRRHRIVPSEPATVSDSWPLPIRLYTLGRFEIVCDDEPLHSSGKVQHRPIELLKCLCAFGGHAVNQDRLTDILWPDTDGDAADQALRTTLHRLRKLLRNEQVLRLEDRHLQLNFNYFWADCLAFKHAARNRQTMDKASLQRALALYQGPFLHGESAPWASALRDDLAAHFLGMSERLGLLFEQDDNWVDAADCYLRAIEVEPIAESFYRRLMHCNASLGRRAEALKVYERCRQALLGRLGVSPTQQTQLLYQQLARY